VNLVFVDCEAYGGAPSVGRLTEFGAVTYPEKLTFHGVLLSTRPSAANPAVPKRVSDMDEVEYLRIATECFSLFEAWLYANTKGRPIFVSDNPAFDWQWINDLFWRTLGRNPFGHSARRISDFYAGLTGDFYRTQQWKSLRITPHDHDPVHDALGNVEAFERLLKGERP
jgi:hypothetical protein